MKPKFAHKIRPIRTDLPVKVPAVGKYRDSTHKALTPYRIYSA